MGSRVLAVFERAFLTDCMNGRISSILTPTGFDGLCSPGGEFYETGASFGPV